ncbi:MAG TPA: M56 family metallopeptidase [Candidatus Kapabacteria bacterium]|nr:M56 family metallopeptidase [Candidatus Kapabacteria bacterium]
METIFQFQGFAMLAELFLKSTVILSLALGLSLLARKQPASFRHLLLGFSLLGLLVLPFLSAFMPGWQTGLVPSWITQPGKSTTVTIVQVLTPSPNAGSANHLQLQAHLSTGNQMITKGYWFLKPQYRLGFTAIWLLVSGLMLIKILFGLYGASRLTRQGISMKGYPWQHLFLWFLEKMSLKRNVRLIKNQRIAMPMTWGILKPVVLMPPASVKWPVEHCSSVLFHELSHVKRGDFLVQLLCRIACSLYWLNPLTWIAFKLLRKEQEKACDEMVLQTGIKPSTYASALLHLKQVVDKGHYMPSPAIGMAGNSELNERLMTILEKKFKTKEIKMKTKLMLLVLVFLSITLIGTAKPEQTQTTANTEQTAVAKDTAADTEKPKIAGEKQENEEKIVHQCMMKCQLKDGEKTQVKYCEKCRARCCEKCEHKCMMKCKHEMQAMPCMQGELGKHGMHEMHGMRCMRCMRRGDGKEKKVIVIIEDDGEDKGEKEKVEKIVICKGEAGEIEKCMGKEGKKCCKQIIICGGEEGKEGKDGDTIKECVIMRGCPAKGKNCKMEFLSENKIGGDLLGKIKESAKTLQGKLPESCKVTTELSETAQKIMIDCPMAKCDPKTCETAQKYIDEFEKEFKNLLPATDGKKTLQKKIFINTDVKETDVKETDVKEEKEEA